MHNEDIIHQVIMLHKQGLSKRAIARAVKIGRNRVRRILAAHIFKRQNEHQALPNKSLCKKRASKLDPYLPQINSLLTQYVDITAQRVFEEIRQQGYTGGYSLVKLRLRQLRPKRPSKISLPTPCYGPGEMAESDFATYQVTFTNAPNMRLYAFGYVLVWSRRKCFSFHQSQDFYALMDGHQLAFERLDGVAKACKYDNQKAVVLRWEGGQPIYNPRFIDFATYYELSPRACRPYHPNDKPRVERSFWELEKSFFNGRSFRDLDDLSRQLIEWMDTICDQRRPKGWSDTIAERFLQEKPHLTTLPTHPYDTARVVYRLCDLEGCIRWDGNRYEVPYDYVTDILPVRITATELYVYGPDLKCVATHKLESKSAGKRVTLPGRKIPSRSKKAKPDLDQLKVVFDSMGDKVASYFGRLRVTPCAAYHGRKILQLRERYATTDLIKALGHADRFGVYDHHVIERILLARATPRQLEEYTAEVMREKLNKMLGEDKTEPRDLAEYDAIPCLSWPSNKPEGENHA